MKTNKKAVVGLTAIIVSVVIVSGLTAGVTTTLSSKTRETTKKEINSTMNTIMQVAEENRENSTNNDNNNQHENCLHETTIIRNVSETYTGDICCSNCNIILQYGEEILISVKGTKWQLNEHIYNYEFFEDSFDFETQSGWECYENNTLLYSEDKYVEVWQLNSFVFLEKHTLGPVHGSGTDTIVYMPENNLGIESGWYFIPSAVEMAIMYGQINDINEIVDFIYLISEPILEFPNVDNSEFERPELINWLQNNATRLQ